MADLTITPGNVQSYGAQAEGIAGVAINAGDVLAKNSSQQLILASDDTAANADVVGIALNDGAANQPIKYHLGGLIDLGATVLIGKVYVLSTSGGIAPVDDVAGGEIVTVIGVGTAADRMLMGLIKSGVAAAGAVT